MSIKLNKNLILIILIFSAFLPYLSTLPIRIEQLIIYFFGFMFLFNIFVSFKIPKNGIYISSILLILVFFSLIPIIFIDDVNLQMLNSRSLLYIISDIERLIRVIFIILIVTISLKSTKAEEFYKIKNACINTFLFLLIINTSLILFIFISDILPTYLLENYWNTDKDNLTDTVAGRSYLNGRFTGIFTQPMESGFTYGLGVLLLLYKNKFKFLFNFRDFIILIFLMIGGILSISKIFFLGIFFIIILIVFLKFKNTFLNLITLLFLITVAFIIFNLVSVFEWAGMKSYSIIFSMFSSFEPAQIIDALSAGRFSNPESPITLMINQVSEYSPFFGFGAGSFAANEVPVDSGYMLFYYQAGMIGFLIFFTTILIMVVLQSLKIINSPGDDNLFLYLLLIYILGTSIGSPVLFLNRSGTILWVFVILFLIHEDKKIKITQ